MEGDWGRKGERGVGGKSVIDGGCGSGSKKRYCEKVGISRTKPHGTCSEVVIDGLLIHLLFEWRLSCEVVSNVMRSCGKTFPDR